MAAENLFYCVKLSSCQVIIANHSVDMYKVGQLKTDVELGSEEEDLEWDVE